MGDEHLQGMERGAGKGEKEGCHCGWTRKPACNVTPSRSCSKAIELVAKSERIDRDREQKGEAGEIVIPKGAIEEIGVLNPIFFRRYITSLIVTKT